VNLGDDADTVGVVGGQLAGAIYGFSSIPDDWMKRLAWKDELVQLARRLVDLNST
jgi:ADP-ribosyl-[dinitrogen reductase] hydrolase